MCTLLPPCIPIECAVVLIGSVNSRQCMLVWFEIWNSNGSSERDRPTSTCNGSSRRNTKRTRPYATVLLTLEAVSFTIPDTYLYRRLRCTSTPALNSAQPLRIPAAGTCYLVQTSLQPQNTEGRGSEEGLSVLHVAWKSILASRSAHAWTSLL